VWTDVDEIFRIDIIGTRTKRLHLEHPPSPTREWPRATLTPPNVVRVTIPKSNRSFRDRLFTDFCEIRLGSLCVVLLNTEQRTTDTDEKNSLLSGGKYCTVIQHKYCAMTTRATFHVTFSNWGTRPYWRVHYSIAHIVWDSQMPESPIPYPTISL